METAGPPDRPSLPDWLAVVRPRLTEPLFQPKSVERLLSVTDLLPWDGLGALETRLASGAGAVDLSVRLSKAAQWRFLSESGSPLSAVRSVWLEYDLDRAGGLPEPVPCAKLPADADPLWVVDVLLPVFHGRPLAREQRDGWLACQRQIPPPAYLLYAFSLRARGAETVRMEFFGLGAEQILAYLGQVAPDTVPQVAEIAPLFDGVERLHLSFDLSPEGKVLPRVGIEGSFPRLPRREPRWEALFERLEERGLCDPEKRKAALVWPGYDSFWTAPERWPVETVGPRGFCVRGLSHVKVVCRPDGKPEAKVYLSFGSSETARRLPERAAEPAPRRGARSSRRTSEPAAR